MQRSNQVLLLFAVIASVIASPVASQAQQTLGAINGTVTDISGAAVLGAPVVVTSTDTGLSHTAKTSANGAYAVQNLPIGAYTISVTQAGFETEKLAGISVQENRTATVNIQLKPGSTNESIEVTATPLLNATDVTNGYVLDKAQIEATPLATGSFTQLAILAPGVSAELLNGVGANAGLGNQPIWANGQRDTSNSLQVNGVDVSNLFNGKTSSQSTSQRLNFNIGETAAPGGNSSTSSSVYGANGQGLASPPPEMIQELRVNTSMYDAQQGTSSGAHVDVNTATGGNQWHSQIWGNGATNYLNAAQFFLKEDPSVPANLKNPGLHRYAAGASAGGPILKDKLFFFGAYQHTNVDDHLQGLSLLQVPVGLTDDRSPAGLNNALQAYNGDTIAPTDINPAAQALLSYKFPNGQYLIPSASDPAITNDNLGNSETNAYIASVTQFKVDQANGALDYQATLNDRLSLKYFYQHAPVIKPVGVSSVLGFTQQQDAGAQVAAIDNTIAVNPQFNWEQRFGFSRQKVYSNYTQQINPADVGISLFTTNFPGISVGQFGVPGGSNSTGSTLNIGPASDFVNDGYFQNRWSPSTNAIWALGRHTISAGASYNYTQLNIRNDRVGNSTVNYSNFEKFLQGSTRSGTYLIGDTSRYYRSNEVGAYVQDKWQAMHNLSITAGLRYDFNGPLTEKYGNLFNFEPNAYSVTPDFVNDSGFIVAGNNKLYHTPGVSNSTLLGRQWGLGPRLGFALSPERFHDKLVVRGGFGMYYDRGEYFSYLSQPAGSGVGGPFGVTQAPPLADYVNASGPLNEPFGSTPPTPPSGNPADFTALLPTQNQIRNTCTAAESQNAGPATNFGCSVKGFPFGAYDRHNTLPYSINWNLDLQYQFSNNLAVTLGYVANGGRHLIIPLPFNQPQVASTADPVNGEIYNYGYQVLSPTNQDENGAYLPMSTEPYDTYDGGNVDLRVPFIGYDPNSTLFRAAGVSSYNALQAHVERRLSHGIQFGFSYTWSHTLDEQSALGLFFTGDNPNRLGDSYASSDFDRTNIFNFNYLFELPKFSTGKGWLDKVANGWSLRGLTTLQSGQPYSIYDYSGAVGSIFYGTNVSLLNPIVPLAPGYTAKSALSGHSGAFKDSSGNSISALKPEAFTIPSLQPGEQGVPPCDASGGPNGGTLCDIYETNFASGQRNIFRQSFQKRADISIQKVTSFTERVSVRYTFDVFNVTNTPSFDVPGNNTNIDPNFGSGFFGNAQVQPGPTTPQSLSDIYVFPTAENNQGLGVVNGLIGGPRVIEMSLHVLF